MEKNLKTVLFVAFAIIVLTLAFFVFQPFLGIIVLAIILTLLFQPLYEKMLRINKKGKNLFAFICASMALIFLILPVLFFGSQIFRQLQIFFALSPDSQGHYFQAIQYTVESLVHPLFPHFTFTVGQYTSAILNFISNNLGVWVSQTTYLFFQIFLLLFTFFFFLRDSEQLSQSLMSLSPFDKEQTKAIFNSTYRVVVSVVRGTLFVGLVRLVLLIAGFYIFGIPNALLWGSIGGLIGVIPGLGTPFVIVPTIIYLAVSGHMIQAIGMGFLGILIIVCIDNMLSAYYFKKWLDIQPIFILFSILGGVLFFGPLGFIFGPIVLSLCASVIEMYKILILNVT